MNAATAFRPEFAPGPPSTPGRSLLKAISWRAVGTIDTMILCLLFLGNIGQALTIGFAEIFTKVALYYGHERLWERIPFWRDAHGGETRRRSVVKTMSWRGFATLDTFILSYLITSKPGAAAGIATAELVTKTLLYYVHERAWSARQRNQALA